MEDDVLVRHFAIEIEQHARRPFVDDGRVDGVARKGTHGVQIRAIIPACRQLQPPRVAPATA